MRGKWARQVGKEGRPKAGRTRMPVAADGTETAGSSGRESHLTDSRAPDQHRCSPTSYLSSTRHQAVPQGTEY